MGCWYCIKCAFFKFMQLYLHVRFFLYFFKRLNLVRIHISLEIDTYERHFPRFWRNLDIWVDITNKIVEIIEYCWRVVTSYLKRSLLCTCFLFIERIESVIIKASLRKQIWLSWPIFFTSQSCTFEINVNRLLLIFLFRRLNDLVTYVCKFLISSSLSLHPIMIHKISHSDSRWWHFLQKKVA